MKQKNEPERDWQFQWPKAGSLGLLEFSMDENGTALQSWEWAELKDGEACEELGAMFEEYQACWRRQIMLECEAWQVLKRLAAEGRAIFESGPREPEIEAEAE